jgi:hypothetical protein
MSAGVKRIVYLGGIVSGDGTGLSPHLRSRHRAVGEHPGIPPPHGSRSLPKCRCASRVGGRIQAQQRMCGGSSDVGVGMVLTGMAPFRGDDRG